MKIHDKQLIKTAANVQAQFQKLRTACFDESNRLSYLATADLDRLKNLRRSLEICHRHRWQGASGKLTARILRIVRDFPPLLDAWERSIRKVQTPLPTLRELVEDLVQIQQEFGRLEINRTEATLSVFTDPITLEDVVLGDFEIRLHVDALSHLHEAQVFAIIALDPHCPADNDLVTHPHVSDDCLCMGDASATIHSALSSGRLCDAFLMVKSVLETYNPASPYVALDKWEGHPCYDCGDHMGEEEGFYCQNCECDFCEECVEMFDCCERNYCYGCKKTCSACEGSCCPKCPSVCQGCGETICGDCLKPCEQCDNVCCTECLNEDYCPTCNEERNTEDEKENNETDTLDTEQHVA